MQSREWRKVARATASTWAPQDREKLPGLPGCSRHARQDKETELALQSNTAAPLLPSPAWPNMHHFATPLRPAQQTKSKRKRDDDGADPQEDLVHDANDNPQPEVQPAPLYDRWDREQRRVAGLSSDDAFQIPAPPFPHAPPREPRSKFTPARIQQELAGLTLSIHGEVASSQDQPLGSKRVTPALRTTHLNILSTVMHRCLLEGDYQRAARAWGMMLRTQAHGIPIEPRYNGLWGLGAELLLRRRYQSTLSGIDEQDSPASDEHLCSEEGFQLAKDYYERLILQYPVRSFQPHAIDATTFYPPLFSVWLMQVLERSRRSRRQLKREAQMTNVPVSIHLDGGMTLGEKRTREAEIQHEELAGAREICRRLTELVESPPYDKNAQLLILRGHAGLWMSDLLLGKTVTLEPDDELDYDSDSDSNKVEDEAETDIAEKTRKRSEGLEAMEQAKSYFEQAIKLCKEVSAGTTSSFEMEVRDITKRIEELKTPQR
ncbi:uncharacterized protein N0V89_001058 [Didymosphaeria variabile]|uniref:Uncharacterized protein n=1 Tax=Didymosphaeria variabile TaxID=1932322 RepID=A0A9W8XVU2_9PLEO|nr:uncharacterized protein N0V89_001058 [Didymosphaeria variabile]KAJ4360493.1 hypothetical protein N0V89_001058 [Didymosphaeria variabile]